MLIEDHNTHQATLNDSGQILSGTGNEDSVYSLNDTHNLICRFFCLVSDISRSNIVLPKSELSPSTKVTTVRKSWDRYKIFFCHREKANENDFAITVERKHGEGDLEKLSGDIYEVMVYGEGIRESLPKSWFHLAALKQTTPKRQVHK